jgi:2-polyprenyl-3-methyl-5-hydroxy-6-metoxy-1,4-benzoquinol methylase
MSAGLNTTVFSHEDTVLASKNDKTDYCGPKPKLLVAIASYGTAGDKHLARLIKEYRGMPFDSHVVVLSNIKKSLPEGVEIKVGLPAQNPWSLPWAHKTLFAERVNDYDLFIYSEDDILITQRNIESFLTVSRALSEAEIPGFLRFEKGRNGTRHYIGLHGHYHWDPQSVCERGPYTFSFLTNEHAGCYLLTRRHLQDAIATRRYLVAPHQGKYDLACTAATDPYTVCGFRKLICISHLEDFLVHHLPDKYTGPEFTSSEQEFDRQLTALMRIHDTRIKPVSLIQTETRLPAAMYSKQYDEAVRKDILNLVCPSVHRVLSLGSGWGKVEKALQQKGHQVTAVPLDPVVGACLEGSDIELVYGDLSTALEKLAGENFDCLLLSNILHLVPNPETVLGAYSQLLSPGGLVILVTPNVACTKNRLNGLLRRHGYRGLGRFEESGVQSVSIGSVKKWLTAAELTIESVEWVASPRFERIVRFGRACFGPMFGAEIIISAKKTTRRAGKVVDYTARGFRGESPAVRQEFKGTAPLLS